MTEYHIRKTPDYSPLIVHLTRSSDRKMVKDDAIGDDHPLHPFKNLSSRERLLKILETKTIYASPMPFLPDSPEAVCFTECIWRALLGHATRYSPYGLVFSKKLLFEQGGGPALYIRGDIIKEIWDAIPPQIEAMIAPFDPEGKIVPGNKLDWLHEREWRLPSSLNFEYSDIKYVIVDTVQDVTDVVQHIGTHHIPQDKFIPMDVYRTIEEVWSEKK
jgi:hypothetical protein